MLLCQLRRKEENVARFYQLSYPPFPPSCSARGTVKAGPRRPRGAACAGVTELVFLHEAGGLGVL